MQFEKLYDELANGAQVIRALLSGVTQEQAILRPEPESWSILEVACHLLDGEREDFRLRLDSILHRPEEEWPLMDPGTWIEGRGYNQRDLASTLQAFLDERQKSLAWLKSLAAPDWEVEHVDPYGSIKAGEMLACWVAHDNLHTRQLVELRRGRLVRLAEPYDVSYAGEW